MALFRNLLLYIQILRKLRGYEPKSPTFRDLHRWVRQFPAKDRTGLIRLAANLQFFSKQETVRSLAALNQKALRILEDDGIGADRVIYISTDSAGSSSGVMLNLLRNHANLEQQGARLLHSRDADGIRETTMKMEFGAIIYIDDFAATGKQFSRSRQAVAEQVIGVFSEFFLLPCICEEARARIHQLRVMAMASLIHRRTERPLLEDSGFLSPQERQGLLALSRRHWGRTRKSLGFNGLATNVVFYTNAPNTTPLILRGHRGQEPLQGVVPRHDDLPVQG